VTPDSSSTSSHSSALPVYSRGRLGEDRVGRVGVHVGLAGAAHRLVAAEQVLHAAVATSVRGHSVFDAMPSPRSSSANAKAHNDIPYLAIM
jgi:hypothetical protein